MAGFVIGETTPFGRIQGGTMAVLPDDEIILPTPLSPRDRSLTATLRGIPYRDPDGTRTNKEILRVREAEIVAEKRKKISEKNTIHSTGKNIAF